MKEEEQSGKNKLSGMTLQFSPSLPAYQTSMSNNETMSKNFIFIVKD